MVKIVLLACLLSLFLRSKIIHPLVLEIIYLVCFLLAYFIYTITGSDPSDPQVRFDDGSLWWASTDAVKKE